MRNIYLISGLGADERVFANLDFTNLNPVFIKWIVPEKNESLGNYAHRLSAQITTENPIVLGVSFGGMIATEIGKRIHCKQIILVSSAQKNEEIPFIYRFFGFFRLHKLLPSFIFKQANFISFWLFGMKTPEERALLTSIINDLDTHFLNWAIHAILTWKNEIVPKNSVKIHGTNDLILPAFAKKTLHRTNDLENLIENGRHLLIYNEPKKVNSLLQKIIFQEE